MILRGERQWCRHLCSWVPYTKGSHLFRALGVGQPWLNYRGWWERGLAAAPSKNKGLERTLVQVCFLLRNGSVAGQGLSQDRAQRAERPQKGVYCLFSVGRHTSRTAKTRLETKMHVGGAGHTVETAWLQQISWRGLRKVFAKLKRQPDKAVCKATYKRKL